MLPSSGWRRPAGAATALLFGFGRPHDAAAPAPADTAATAAAVAAAAAAAAGPASAAHWPPMAVPDLGTSDMLVHPAKAAGHVELHGVCAVLQCVWAKRSEGAYTHRSQVTGEA